MIGGQDKNFVRWRIIKYENDFNFYKKIKQKILEKEKDLNNFTKKGSKVYGFDNRYQSLYQQGLITEIEYARKRKDIKTAINNYEQEITRLESLIEDMKDFVNEFESLFKPNRGLWVIHATKLQPFQISQK